MSPRIFDIQNDADAERFNLSTTRPGKWDAGRSARDYLLARRIEDRDGATPKIIVLHTQQGNTPGSLGHWVSGKNKFGAPITASATVTIQKDGTILRVIPEKHGPWTNGDINNPTEKGREIIRLFGDRPNTYTLSIEAEGHPDDEMPRAQLEAIAWQVEQWMNTYDIPLERVVRHADFNSSPDPTVTRRFCPGKYYVQVLALLEPEPRFEPFGGTRVFHVPPDRRATVRSRPNRAAPEVTHLMPGTEVECDGIYRGQEVGGDDRWLRTSGTPHGAIHASGLVEGRRPRLKHAGLGSPPGWEALNAHNDEIRQAAEKTGVPPNLLKAMINRESSGNWERNNRVHTGLRNQRMLPFVGIFENAARSWGLDFEAMIGNKTLQIEGMARILAGLAERYGGFDRAVTVYFGGEAALAEEFVDEFGMSSTEYNRRAIADWQALDRLSQEG